MTTPHSNIPQDSLLYQSGKSDNSEQPLADSDRLISLEATIERGLQTFVEVGNALMEIRDRRLYRFSHDTFVEYCRERWGMGRAHAYRLIGAAQTVINLKESNQLVTFPTNEAQTRPLIGLPSEQQIGVWSIVVETAPNGKVTMAHVQQTVKYRRSPKKSERLTPCDCCGWPISQRHHFFDVAIYGENEVTIQLCANCHEAFHIMERAFSDFASGKTNTKSMQTLGVIAKHLGLEHPTIKRLDELYDLKRVLLENQEIFISTGELSNGR